MPKERSKIARLRSSMTNSNKSKEEQFLEKSVFGNEQGFLESLSSSTKNAKVVKLPDLALEDALNFMLFEKYLIFQKISSEQVAAAWSDDDDAGFVS